MFDGGDGKGSAAAGSDADDDIFFSRLHLLNRFAAEFAGVFIGFDGGGQRFITSGDDELNHARRDIESGRAFDGIEGGDSTAGAGAYVDQAASAGKRVSYEINCERDLRQSALYGRGDLCVFGVDDASDFERRLAIEIDRNGVGLFGAEAADACAGFAAHWIAGR